MKYDPKTDTVRHDDGTAVDLTDAATARAAHETYVTALIDADRRRTRATRLALVLVAVGALIVAAFIFSARAKADRSWFAVTMVYWSGTNCIDIWEPTYARYDYMCGGAARYTVVVDTPGQIFGVDPIMGDADRINCTVTMNGRVDYADSAEAGDGTDVNCIRELIGTGFGRMRV